MQRDRASGLDLAGLRVSPRVVDKGLWNPLWSIHKFHDHRDRVYKAGRQGLPISYLLENFELFDKLRMPGNLLLYEGINELWALICGTGATKFDNANAYMGVGDSATAADPVQTGLQASTNKLYKAMDTSYPTYGTSQKATHRSTFGSAEANFHWQEITVSNTNSDSGKNLNRKVQDMGTKASGSTWVATLETTLA